MIPQFHPAGAGKTAAEKHESTGTADAGSPDYNLRLRNCDTQSTKDDNVFLT